METIWNSNERLIKNFTGHGVEHSDRIARNILCLLETDKEIDKLENDYEGEVFNLGGSTNNPIKMQSPLYTILRNSKMEVHS